MKRTPLGRGGKPLQRKAPMSAGGTPLARTPMKARRARSAPARTSGRADDRAPARPRPTRRHTGPSAETRALVDVRDGGKCVRCGQPANNRDHRRTRGSGGSHGAVHEAINQPSNLLTLCGSGNTSGCHAWKDEHRADALRDGYALPLNGALINAELVPVRTRRSRTGWARFLNDGAVVPCPPPPNDDAREAYQG